MAKDVQLFHFINENDIELRWDDGVLSSWFPPDSIKDFCRIAETALEESGVDCVLCASGFIWIDLVPICEWYGLDPQFLLRKDQ